MRILRTIQWWYWEIASEVRLRWPFRTGAPSRGDYEIK